MKVKKLLVLALCMVTIASISVVATLAYFTDTAAVDNTFTVGHVGISMDEYKTDEYGVANTAVERVTENTYKLVPGHQYTKDPTIHIDADSEDCFLFVKVVNEIEAIETDATETKDGVVTTLGTIAEQMAANGWDQLADDEGNLVENVYYYADDDGKAIVENSADVPVFKAFKINPDVVGGKSTDEGAVKGKLYLGDYAPTTVEGTTEYKTVTVNAYAIQADGFNGNAYTAWTSGNFQ